MIGWSEQNLLNGKFHQFTCEREHFFYCNIQLIGDLFTDELMFDDDFNQKNDPWTHGKGESEKTAMSQI